MGDWSSVFRRTEGTWVSLHWPIPKELQFKTITVPLGHIFSGLPVAPTRAFGLVTSKHKEGGHTHVTIHFERELWLSARARRGFNVKYGFCLKQNSLKRENDFSIGKGSPSKEKKNVNRWLRRITHMLHADPEEALLRMKWHFPAWATSHRSPYFTHGKTQGIYMWPGGSSLPPIAPLWSRLIPHPLPPSMFQKKIINQCFVLSPEPISSHTHALLSPS